MDLVSPSLASRIHYGDFRHHPPDELPAILTQTLAQTDSDGMLWVAKRPRKNWFQGLCRWQPHCLASSALFEQIFWLRTGVELPFPLAIEEEFQQLLEGYSKLFQAPEASLEEYLEVIRLHIRRQESQEFRELEASLPVGRALQELRYEHRGLERGLDRIAEALPLWRRQELSPSAKERLDLDFFHLLEHHVERERDALYPLLVFVEMGGRQTE